MKYSHKESRLATLARERNNAFLLIASLLLICLVEAMTIYHLMDDRRTGFTPLPQIVSAPFEISRNYVSSAYLADMTRYFATLRLNYTPETLKKQIDVLLHYTDGSFYGDFKETLDKELSHAKAHDVSLSFSADDTKVDEKKLAVMIYGDLIETVGKNTLPKRRVAYEIDYHYADGVLRVTDMRAIKNQ